MSEKTPQFREVMASIGEAGGGKHSPLYLWMRQNHHNIARQVSQGGMPWAKFTEAVAKAGLTDRKGQPPREKTVRQTWFRVGQEMKRRVASTALTQSAGAVPHANSVAIPGISVAVREVFAPNPDAVSGREAGANALKSLGSPEKRVNPKVNVEDKPQRLEARNQKLESKQAARDAEPLEDLEDDGEFGTAGLR